MLEQGVAQRVRALEAFLNDVYDKMAVVADGVIPRQLVTTSAHFHRQVHGFEPAGGVRVHISGIDVVRDAAGHLPRPRGQRPRALRRQLRPGKPPRHGQGPARGIRPAAHPAGRGVPPPAAVRPAQDGTVRRRRPHRGGPDPRRLQQRLLRAHPARRPDGRGTRRGPRPHLPRQPRLHAHHRRRTARRRDLQAHRRRVPGPAAVPRRLHARLPGPGQRRPRRRRHHRQRRGQRRRRRQAGLQLRPGPDPLLPQRRARDRQRGHLPAGGEGSPGRGPGPAGRARGQARGRFRRQGPRDRPGCLQGRTRCPAQARHRGPPRLDRAAGPAAVHRPHAQRRQVRPAARGPAPLRRQRRRRRLGPARRPDPRGAQGRLTDRELQPGRRLQGHLGAGGFAARCRWRPCPRPAITVRERVSVWPVESNWRDSQKEQQQ